MAPKKKKSKQLGESSDESPNSDLSGLPDPFQGVDDYGYGLGSDPRTLLELKIIQMSYAIRSKPDWKRKVEDKEIVEKWKSEASGQGLDEQSVSYVLDEVRYLASLKDDDPINLSLLDGIFESDSLIDSELRDGLIKDVSVLENVPESQKDWHPGSDDQGIIHKLGLDPPSDVYVGKYQWIPSDIAVDKDRGVKFESYINNLHPEEHKEMYGKLEKILGKSIPLFERVLTSLKNPKENIVKLPDGGWYPDEEEPNFSDDDDDSAYENWVQNRPITIPKPHSFAPPAAMPEPVSLRGRKLQVIVKLANIQLTPEKPAYPGGVWHVEGMKNEGIVGTVIYYYVCENITESRLGFRQAVKEPDYEQNDNRGVQVVYGLEDEQALNQELGSVLIKEGMCLGFPNIYQHRVAPFELEDKTKNGYRKILVFFLVDPSKPILSTRNIPPQQKDWMLRELRSDDMNLPAVAERVVHSYTDWPLTMDQAREYREKLMEERKYVISANNERYFERAFSLCEH